MVGRYRRNDIPSIPDDLNPAWATVAMREAGVLPADVEVVELTIGPLGGGKGFGGDAVRVFLTYSTPGAGPPTAVAKFATANRVNKGLFESQDSYGREILFYQSLAHRVPIRVPQHLGSAMDGPSPRPVTAARHAIINRAPKQVHITATANVIKLLRPSKRRYALLVEEIENPGTYDMTQPPDPALLEPVVDTLASLHAGFWGAEGLPHRNAMQPILGAMPRLYSNTYHPVNRPIALDRWTWLTGRDLDALDDAASRLPTDHTTINEPVTLVHADPRVDNVMFVDTSEPILIDWGLVTVGHPAYDLAYLCSSALDGENARAAADALLGRYVDALTANGRSIDPDELRAVFQASLRALSVQLMTALSVLHGGYGNDTLSDIWMPRLLRLLDPVG